MSQPNNSFSIDELVKLVGQYPEWELADVQPDGAILVRCRCCGVATGASKPQHNPGCLRDRFNRWMRQRSAT